MLEESKKLQNSIRENIKKSVINMMDTDFDQFITMIIEDLRQDQAVKVYGDSTCTLIQTYLAGNAVLKSIENIEGKK